MRNLPALFEQCRFFIVAPIDIRIIFVKVTDIKEGASGNRLIGDSINLFVTCRAHSHSLSLLGFEGFEENFFFQRTGKTLCFGICAGVSRLHPESILF